MESKELATRADILLVNGKINEMELRLQKEIVEVKSSLIKWIIGTEISASMVMCGAVFTLLKLMIHS